MFRKRSLFVLAALAAACMAHAGPISILGSYEYSDSDAYSSDAGGFNFGQLDFNFAPGYRYSYAFSGGAHSGAFDASINYASLSDTANSSSLFGVAQSYGEASVVGGAASYYGYAYHELYFALTATSTVDLKLWAQVDGATSTGKKSGAATDGASFANLWQLTTAGWVNMVGVSDTDLFTGTLGAGIYAFNAYGITAGNAYGRVAQSSGNSFGAYSLDAVAVPEPVSFAALACGVVALRRRKQA